MNQWFTRILVLSITLLAAISDANCQLLSEKNFKFDSDSVLRDFDNAPMFTLYKDNYFVFGPSVGSKPTRENTNVKFQISIAVKLTKSTLPFGTYLYLFYTQKCIWNVMEESLPMRDINYNPGIGLAKPIKTNDGRFVGVFQFGIEHESNGRDSIFSRSWNRITFGGNVMISPRLNVHGKIWIPIVDGENNKDLLKYAGICQAGLSYNSLNRNFGGTILFTKRKTWKPDFNTTVELYYRPFKKSNIFLFLQYYNGYNECLIDYNQFSNHLRAGIVIRPTMFSNY